MANIAAYADEARQLRRVIHRHPEEGWTEFETTWLVVRRLRELGFTVSFGESVVDPAFVILSDSLRDASLARAQRAGVPESFLRETEGFTGAVGILDTGRPGPLTAFRFDMDCVLVDESCETSHTPAREGFASQYPGLMHACGHDAHTAVGLSLAHWLADHRDFLCGRFKLIFQPAEEGTRGARAMAAKGVVDDVDWLFGAHVGTFAKSGEIIVCRSGFLATNKIDIEFRGVASHAGAEPNKGKSALVAACSAVMMMQGISRHADGDSRIAIGTLHAGEGRNVTPVHARLQVEVRGETHEVNEFMTENVRNMVEGAARAYGVESSLRIVGAATTLETTERGNAILEATAKTVPNTVTRTIDRMGGSEDCTILLRRAREHGAETGFFLYGCQNQGHHRPDFDLDDTRDLLPGLAVFIGLAERINTLS